MHEDLSTEDHSKTDDHISDSGSGTCALSSPSLTGKSIDLAKCKDENDHTTTEDKDSMISTRKVSSCEETKSDCSTYSFKKVFKITKVLPKNPEDQTMIDSILESILDTSKRSKGTHFETVTEIDDVIDELTKTVAPIMKGTKTKRTKTSHVQKRDAKLKQKELQTVVETTSRTQSVPFVNDSRCINQKIDDLTSDFTECFRVSRMRGSSKKKYTKRMLPPSKLSKSPKDFSNFMETLFD